MFFIIKISIQRKKNTYKGQLQYILTSNYKLKIYKAMKSEQESQRKFQGPHPTI